MSKHHFNSDCEYDYNTKCDCSDDDNCGCTYPNNMGRTYNETCFNSCDKTEISDIDIDINKLIGRPAPDFTAPAVLSGGTMVEKFNLYRYTTGHSAVLFFYPDDFSFTCPSELLMLNKELNAFNRRSTKVIAISTDSIYSHLAWKDLPPEKDGISDINYPLVADENKTISKSYGVLNHKQTARRATIILDEDKIIRHISLNDNKIWRNPTEIIRIIDIMHYKTNDITACPPGWKQNFFFERPEPQSLTEIYARKNSE